jgi:hypothetical protein
MECDMTRPQEDEIKALLNNHARSHPDIIWPSSNGYGAIWISSTCTDTAIFFPTATETETRYGLIARDSQNERARLITGESTCRGSKDVNKHIANKHHVGVRTVKTANAHYCRDKLTARSD